MKVEVQRVSGSRTVSLFPEGDNEPGSWGGHAVFVAGYSADYVKILTWGKVHLATWPWMAEYCDEAYCLLSPDWINASGKSPEGLDRTKLLADMANLTG